MAATTRVFSGAFAIPRLFEPFMGERYRRGHVSYKQFMIGVPFSSAFAVEVHARKALSTYVKNGLLSFIKDRKPVLRRFFAVAFGVFLKPSHLG